MRGDGERGGQAGVGRERSRVLAVLGLLRGSESPLARDRGVVTDLHL